MIPMILQAEFAKALGQAISRRLPQNHKKEILCLGTTGDEMLAAGRGRSLYCGIDRKYV